MTIFVFGTGDSSSELGLGPEVKEARRATVIPALDLCEDGIDGGHLGLNLSQEQTGGPKLVRRYEFGRPRIILKPLTVPYIGDAIHVACSTGHTIFVNSEGKAFASGFGFQYQLGNGMTDDIETTTEGKTKALKNVELSWFCAAGQYSMVEAPVAETYVMGSNKHHRRLLASSVIRKRKTMSNVKFVFVHL
ncbi:hypothetical protein F5883DRAFT_563873 [Diaporthe sp. PMI_573]|nr:hypothetical protein F5883DRAFT_563873 [Diaporthaceae sp. PMI_573]